MITTRHAWIFCLGLLTLILLVNFPFASGRSSHRAATQVESKTSQAIAAQSQINPKSELKVFAEGSQSSITTPFVALIRDAETWEALRRAAGNLPDTSVDFNSHIMIAAFLGERNTGGYSIEMSIEVPMSVDTSRPVRPYIRIKAKAPQKGTMVPQVITYPYKVVSLEVSPTASVLVAPDSPWQQPLQHYVVTGGTFTMTGGIAGRTDRFNPQGNLWIVQQGKLTTVMFIVFTTNHQPMRMLWDYATGFVDADSVVKINRMSADTFVDSPNTGLKAMVRFGAGGKLLISLTSLPSMIADGYSGMGTIEATLSESMTKRSAALRVTPLVQPRRRESFLH